MKKVLNVLLFALLLPLAIFAQTVAERLPSPPEGVAQQKYESWSGVLRLWVCEGWQSGYGSLNPWLNACITTFEKRHPGVYVQVKSVSAGVMADFASGDINPPDMIVFAPGMLASADFLLPVTGAVRTALADCGAANGARRAMPIAMGGYAWACNASAIRSLPADWAQTQYALRARPDGDSASLSAALLALCAGAETPGEAESPKAGSGMDLGLPIAEPTPTAPPARTETTDCRLSEDFFITEDAYSQFLRGEADAMVATQREIRRLQIASDGGKAPNWAIAAAGEAFSDQIALFAIVNWPREDIEARAALGQALLDHLLADESQARLTLVRALRVTDGDALYAAQSGMAQLEAAYMGKPVLAPNAFDTGWRDTARRLFELFAENQLSARAAYSRLAEALATFRVP